MFERLFGKSSASPVAQLSVRDLSERLKERGALTLIDVRSAEEFRGDGHVAGAKLMPLPALAQQADGLPRDTPIAVICRSGGRSSSGCDVLARMGFTNISNVSGGMMAWQQAGLPVKRG